jgi:hypothetical protein
MTEINQRSFGTRDPLDHQHPNLTPEELAIISYFVRGQKHAASSQNLKLEYTETSIRLSDGNGRLVGISKQVNQWQRKVLISNNSAYRFSNIQALIAEGFIAKQKSSHPDFTEHHYYTIPDGYKINYTEAIQLWKIWWNNKRYQLDTSHPSIDILTFSKGKWYLVQDLQPKQGNFVLRTARGEIKIEPGEYVVWIDSLFSIVTENSEPKAIATSHPISAENQQKLATHPIDDRSSANPNQQILSPTTYLDRLPAPEEDIDLESYLSTFNTEDAEDIDRIEGIYNIGELLSGSTIRDDLMYSSVPPRSAQVPQPAVTLEPVQLESVSANLEQPVSTQLPLSILQQQASLKLKAINVLANYLQVGDRIVRTEVVKNAQGQEINRKVTKIQRGCPSWAIDQIKKLEQ